MRRRGGPLRRSTNEHLAKHNVKEPQHIGIAAITAEGGALAYREIVHLSERLAGRDHHPEITLHSYSFSHYSNSIDQKEKVWTDWLIESSERLAGSGADFMICPANTTHAVYKLAKSKITIPWLHIAEPVAVQARDLGRKKAMLLGTRFLMQSLIYQPYFASHNMAITLPSSADQELIHNVIYDELIRGVVSSRSRQMIIDMIDEYAARDACDCVILGCTELPLLIGTSDVSLPILDSTRILAQGAVAMAYGVSLAEATRSF